MRAVLSVLALVLSAGMSAAMSAPAASSSAPAASSSAFAASSVAGPRPVLVSERLPFQAYKATGDHRPREGAFNGDYSPERGYWNSGTYAPAWIEVDLLDPRPVLSVKLVIAQLPDGDTVHQVWASMEPILDDTSHATLLHTFAGYTRDREVLTVSLISPILARHVQIRTTRSPSWVAWMEVQVFQAPGLGPPPFFEMPRRVPMARRSVPR